MLTSPVVKLVCPALESQEITGAIAGLDCPDDDVDPAWCKSSA